jgi:hypothetical protein
LATFCFVSPSDGSPEKFRIALLNIQIAKIVIKIILLALFDIKFIVWLVGGLHSVKIRKGTCSKINSATSRLEMLREIA